MLKFGAPAAAAQFVLEDEVSGTDSGEVSVAVDRGGVGGVSPYVVFLDGGDVVKIDVAELVATDVDLSVAERGGDDDSRRSGWH